jgi:hypothetical protein
MLFLPEACSFIGESAAETIAMATTLDSPVLERFKDLAACHSLWISLGGYQESSGDISKFYNTHVLLNNYVRPPLPQIL